MKAVITGGAGFIGSHLARALSRAAEVVVIDNFSSGKETNLTNIPITLCKGDINDTTMLRREFEGADCIFHHAAFVSVQESVADPLSAHQNNITGTLKILLAARDAGVKRVILASSAAVYGSNPLLPKREDMLPQPESPYAVSKIAGEYYCRIFSELYGVSTVCLRYFNIYGPYQNPNSLYAAVIPGFIRNIRNGQPPIIFGDGSQTRDFLYIQDVIQANILAMKKDIVGTFNIGSGNQTRISDLATLILDSMDSDLVPVHQNPRKGDIHDSCADISKARQGLSFQPQWSLRKGIEETVAWFCGQ